MIPAKDFAKAIGISQEQVVERIRNGIYIGKLVDGKWFIENTSIKNEAPNSKSGPFARGAMFGLGIGIIIGLVTYPWDRPNFEGAAGYHMLMMAFVLPTSIISFGLLVTIYSKIKASRNV